MARHARLDVARRQRCGNRRNGRGLEIVPCEKSAQRDLSKLHIDRRTLVVVGAGLLAFERVYVIAADTAASGRARAPGSYLIAPSAPDICRVRK